MEKVVGRLLAIGEAAERLGVTTNTIRTWANTRKITAVVTPGGHRRIPEAEVVRILNANKSMQHMPGGVESG